MIPIATDKEIVSLWRELWAWVADAPGGQVLIFDDGAPTIRLSWTELYGRHYRQFSMIPLESALIEAARFCRTWRP